MIKSYPHQTEILEMSRSKPALALLWEMGTGKTKGMIDILRDKCNQHRRIMPTVIFSPPVTLYNWKEEFLKFSNIKEEHILVLSKSGKKRLQAIQTAIGRNKIILVNYESVLNDDFYNHLKAFRPQIIVCDESHYIKSYKSKRAKRIIALGKDVPYKYILTGTPILNSIEDIFMQYKFLDHGATFGKVYITFRNVYMVDENARWAGSPNYFPKWRPRKEKYDELHKRIFRCATRVLKKDCLKDLPPLVKTKRYVELSAEQAKHYKHMKRDFVTFLEKDGETKAAIASIALTKALRLMQIISGHVVTDKGETIEFHNTPRIKALQELLEELTPCHKVIVWCSFRSNYKQISKVCEKLKVKYTLLTGEQNEEQKREAMHLFREHKDYRVIIANRRAGGIGVNLVESGYSIVYSRNFSLGEEKQSEARNHRAGSEIHDRIVKIDLCARDTIDEQIIEALSGKELTSNQIINIVRGQK
jgi:SNF2 family DNA or RNA helicase